MWSRRKFPRKSSRRKVRPAHSFSRDSSAIFRDSCSLVSLASVALRTVAPGRAWAIYQPRRGKHQLTIGGRDEGTGPAGLTAPLGAVGPHRELDETEDTPRARPRPVGRKKRTGSTRSLRRSA